MQWTDRDRHYKQSLFEIHVELLWTGGSQILAEAEDPIESEEDDSDEIVEDVEEDEDAKVEVEAPTAVAHASCYR